MLPWSSSTWLSSVSSWLEDKEVSTTGPLEEVHRQPWSAMLKVPTSSGSLYFKAGAPSLTFEARLTQALARWRPRQTAELVAVDEERGWLLMRDSGVTLRSQLASGYLTQPLEVLFSHYAELQIDMIAHRAEILSFGVPDRRVEEVVRLGVELGLDASVLNDLGAQVTSVQLPDTLIHEEVHDANVLVRDGSEVFIDWADSSVGHPFFGVVVALRSISDRLAIEPGDPKLEGCLDAYLEPWTALAPAADIRASFPPAYRLGMLNRALTWRAGGKDLDADLLKENDYYVDAWIEEFSAATDPLPGT